MAEIAKIGSDNRFLGDYITTRISVAFRRIALSACETSGRPAAEKAESKSGSGKNQPVPGRPDETA